VVSEYYDTAERDALWERERKFRNRRKLRVRIYGSDVQGIPPSAFIEIKHKQDGAGVKRRLRIPVEAVTEAGLDAGCILDLMPRLLLRTELLIADEIRHMLDERRIAPSMQMRYDRLAFEEDDGNVRITFDGGLCCRTLRQPLQPDDREFPLIILPPDERVMEVKLLGPAPSWLRDLTASHRLTRTSFSKYCTALQLYDPAVSSVRQPRSHAA
jgi:SPX domain protein involved in polyphosphate accumulation